MNLPLSGIIPYHPDYVTDYSEIEKWRICFTAGEYFRSMYLKQVSGREKADDFNNRKDITPIPAFASAEIKKIRNKIFQHFTQVRRLDGPKSYQECCSGLRYGVDLRGQPMNSFIGTDVLTELLLMGRVGVTVDMPPSKGPTLAHNRGLRPYTAMYRREDILCWEYDADPEDPTEFSHVLLRTRETERSATGFLSYEHFEYRKYYKDETGVWVQHLDNSFEPDGDPIKLKLDRIPFVIFEISDSLMRYVADHQIALLNLGSLDMNFFQRSNFPTYIESKSPQEGDDNKERILGNSRGIKYSGKIPPSYINPSPDPIIVSIKKQDQLERQIKELLATAVEETATVSAKKNVSSDSIGDGLSHIGLTLQQGEQDIANIWAEFDGKADAATVYYPTVYKSKTDAERVEEAKMLSSMIDKTPSKTFQRVVAKKLAHTLCSGDATPLEMAAILREIDEADIVQSDAETLERDVKGGLVDPETASIARGYPKGSYEKAQEAQALRLALIAIAQQKAGGAGAAAPVLKDAQARGVADAGTPDQGQNEKLASKDSMNKGMPATQGRGPDKKQRQRGDGNVRNSK